MENTEPCNICGCTQTNLVDGFYYCAECGTQDVNVRETLVEYVTVGDGETALRSRRRITKIPEAKEHEMTDDWYKWHCMNFLLRGLADELIEFGAAPSFKTKLLWVWTRYMKKYQNKADFGLETNDDSDENEENEEEKLDMEEDGFDFDDNDLIPVTKTKIYTKDVTKISMNLVQALLYVALNLDKSHIQLAHLMRLTREGRISIMQWQRLVPNELRPKNLRHCLFFNRRCFRNSSEEIRVLALQLFRVLNLGNPIVPDMRPLIDIYMQELCLPNDLKPLVISLMHHRSFDYLDINVLYKEVRRMPSYEIYVMSHILMALKICFSLDGDYEIRLSDAVDKINEIEEHPKSYNSEPTKRLFSFREWYSYIEFRKTVLRNRTLYLGAPNYCDMNDYVAFEHQREKLDYKATLNDEIAMEIIKKIPSIELNVIPRSEFVWTMMPHCSYTRVIIEHQQDPDVKRLLEEDFTQYSLKYIMKDMFLVDIDSVNPQNIIGSASEQNFQICNKHFDFVDPAITFSKGMVYVKDCDNHNWMITQRPQLEHVIESKIDGDEKENDHGYESNSETSQNVTNSRAINLELTQDSVGMQKKCSPITVGNFSKVHNDLSSITNNEMDIENEEQGDVAAIVNDSCMIVDSENESYKNIKNDIDYLKIQEEKESESIFDDDFVDFDIKKEEEPTNDDIEEPCEMNVSLPEAVEYRENYRAARRRRRQDDDNSSEDSIRLNPESLDRNKAIKELVIHVCNKYRVSIPGKYRYFNRRIKQFRKKTYGKVDGPKFRGETTMKINSYVSAYHSHLQHDLFHQMSNMVKSAITDFNNTKEETELPVEPDDQQLVQDEVETTNDQIIENVLNDTTQNTERNDTAVEEDQYNLFSDSSDGETHAEELLPKKNPEFDEETHDIGQLYIKPTEDSGVPEMKLNPSLFNIIDQKIEEDKKNPESANVSKVKEKSDSEEDVCLSLLKEQKLQRLQLTEQGKLKVRRGLNPLLPFDIPSYKYWLRHYGSNYTQFYLNQRFANELDAKLPNNFVFVLKECADVVGYPPYNLYRGLQRVETCLRNKYVGGIKFLPEYIKRGKRRFTKDQEF